MLSLLPPVLLLATAAAPPNPLAPAAQGKIECYSPDTTKKTCRSMAAYRPAPGGGYSNLAVILLSPNPPLLMQITSPVTVRDGMVCGPIRNQDFDGAQFQLNGAAVTPDAAANLRAQMKKGSAEIMGKEVCTRYLPSPTPGARIARALFDGVPKPEQDQTVIWITQADGFRVAP